MNGAKGILIALIVLGHNTILSTTSPKFFSSLYNFHVGSFLLLPFFSQKRDFSRGYFTDRVVRYMVPHFLFFALACAAYYALFLHNAEDFSLNTWAWNIALSLCVGSQEFFKEASGFRFFWFLPTLLAVILVRVIYSKANIRIKIIILSLAMAAHLFTGAVSSSVQSWVPYGIHKAFFLLPPGLFLAWAWRNHDVKIRRFRLLVLALFILCLAGSYRAGSFAVVGAGIRYPTLGQPLSLLFHNLFLSSAVLSAVSYSELLEKNVLVRELGKHSLIIFLSHSFIYRLMLFLGAEAFVAVQGYSVAVGLAVTFIGTLLIALLLSKCIWSSKRLKPLIIPRDLSEFRAGIRLTWPSIRTTSKGT